MDSSLFPLPSSLFTLLSSIFPLPSSLFPLHSSLFTFPFFIPSLPLGLCSSQLGCVAFPRFSSLPLRPLASLFTFVLRAEVGSCKVDTYIQKKVTHI